MTRDDTLAQAIGGADTLTRKLLAVLGGALVIGLGAQVSVPMFPVPMTLQTLAVLLVGLTLGSRLGVASVLTYLAQGAVGLPVFAGGAAGAAYLIGPTAGFLWGFVGMAFLAGVAVERGMARGMIATSLVALVISAAIYVPGVLWLTVITPLSLDGAIAAGMMPFIVGDAVKSVLAGVAIAGGWAALRARRG